jgi:hypothetical protein
MLPKHLVFCGGGTRCLVFLQTLVELEGRGILHDVVHYWGTSAGSLLAALLAVSKSALAVKKVMLSADFSKFRDIDVTNLLNITVSWGMDSGISLVCELERLFELLCAGSSKSTLSKYPGLHIVVADLTTHSTLVCDSNSYPDLRVIDAVRASMSLPIFFRPFEYKGHYWVDGGVRANFPWEYLPSDADRREALGFMIEKGWMQGPKSFSEYIFSIIHFDEPKKYEIWKSVWADNIILYHPPPFPAWFMRLNPDDFALLETLGMQAAEAWFTRIISKQTPKTPEMQLSSVPHCVPLQDSPQRHTDGMLDIRTPLFSLSQDSSPHQLPYKQQTSRRWSV